MDEHEMTSQLMDELMEAMTQHDMKSLKPKEGASVLEIHIHPGGQATALEEPEDEAMEEEKEGMLPSPSMIEEMLKKKG